jgi:hypothetical protein
MSITASCCSAARFSASRARTSDATAKSGNATSCSTALLRYCSTGWLVGHKIGKSDIARNAYAVHMLPRTREQKTAMMAFISACPA